MTNKALIEITAINKIARLLSELNPAELSAIIEYAAEIRCKLVIQERNKLPEIEL